MTSDYKQFSLSGNVYIKYYDDEGPFKQGDLLLYLHDDSISPVAGDYDNTSFSGYFKGKVYDGREWHYINMEEFCEHREYKYAKKQRPLDTALLCCEILSQFKGQIMYRTYRGHFTTKEYQPNERITKASHGRGRKKAKSLNKGSTSSSS